MTARDLRSIPFSFSAPILPGDGDRWRGGPFRFRVKEIGHRIYVAIQNDLRREERALEHELHLYRQMGADPRADEIAAIEADLASVRALIDREPQ